MTTLYEKVQSQILGRIRDGDLRVGERLPPEAELAAELGVSRSTVRLAFSALEESGILSRKKRVGTEVISDTPKHRVSMRASGITDVLSLGQNCEHFAFSTRLERGKEVPHLRGVSEDNDIWLSVFGTMKATGEDRPVCVLHAYIPKMFAGVEPLLAHNTAQTYQLICDTYDVAIGRVQQMVSAVSCTERQAELLDIAHGSPVLELTARIFEVSGAIMQVSVALFDPARFQVNMDVTVT